MLLVGAILTPGQRLVSSALRAVGLSHRSNFQASQRVLSRAIWSSRSASRILLGLLVAPLAPAGPLVLGSDETIERRRGAKMAAAGIYRDPVRSRHSHFVKVRGLRWVCLMLLVPVPWATRRWALPFLTVLGRLGPVPACSSATAPPGHIPDDVGAAADAPGASLAAHAGARRGGGPHRCGAGVTRRSALHGDRHHPAAPRCAAVRPTTAAAAPSEGASPAGG